MVLFVMNSSAVTIYFPSMQLPHLALQSSCRRRFYLILRKRREPVLWTGLTDVLSRDSCAQKLSDVFVMTFPLVYWENEVNLKCPLFHHHDAELILYKLWSPKKFFSI